MSTRTDDDNDEIAFSRNSLGGHSRSRNPEPVRTSLSLNGNINPSSTMHAAMTDITPEKITNMVEIGRGGYGTVYAGRYQHTTVAIKYLDFMIENTDQASNPSKEALIMKSLSHPNIVFIHSYGTHVEQTIQKSYIIMEYCQSGSLRHVIESRHPKFYIDANTVNVLPAVICLISICRALSHLHESSITHGDLSTNNILFDSEMRPKVSDFGLSRPLLDGTVQTQTHGTVSFMPPELLREGTLSSKGDVYAFGIVFYELLTGKQAWENCRYAQIINFKIKSTHHGLELPDHIPPRYGFAELLDDMLQNEYRQRPDFSSIQSRLSSCIE